MVNVGNCSIHGASGNGRITYTFRFGGIDRCNLLLSCFLEKNGTCPAETAMFTVDPCRSTHWMPTVTFWDFQFSLLGGGGLLGSARFTEIKAWIFPKVSCTKNGEICTL